VSSRDSGTPFHVQRSKSSVTKPSAKLLIQFLLLSLLLLHHCSQRLTATSGLPAVLPGSDISAHTHEQQGMAAASGLCHNISNSGSLQAKAWEHLGGKSADVSCHSQ